MGPINGRFHGGHGFLGKSDLLSINEMFTSKNSWNHARLVLEHSLGSPGDNGDDKNISPFLGAWTSGSFVPLLNETLHQFFGYRNQTNWCSDSDLFSKTDPWLASVQGTRMIAHFSDVLPSLINIEPLTEAHFKV
jgi:hypothetical protein